MVAEALKPKQKASQPGVKYDCFSGSAGFWFSKIVLLLHALFSDGLRVPVERLPKRTTGIEGYGFTLPDFWSLLEGPCVVYESKSSVQLA